MNATVLMLAMLAQPEALVGKTQMYKIADTIIPVAKKHKLDPTLIAAIVLAETGGRNKVAYHRGRKKKGADVGVFQIHCRHSSPTCIKRFRDLEEGALAAVKILREGMRICKAPHKRYKRYKRMCTLGFWARYNPGSSFWAKRVKHIWKRINTYIESRISA